ncbi:hypothetical protein HAX54_007987 [Datura stramonium]|uniref:Uncharacterized protein n=1 Tax=Datura stramonium TaxID=4076 RepID=A0ABS8TE31_DATST|nr:hypothetical protein [Datura stramonium]
MSSAYFICDACSHYREARHRATEKAVKDEFEPAMDFPQVQYLYCSGGSESNMSGAREELSRIVRTSVRPIAEEQELVPIAKEPRFDATPVLQDTLVWRFGFLKTSLVATRASFHRVVDNRPRMLSLSCVVNMRCSGKKTHGSGIYSVDHLKVGVTLEGDHLQQLQQTNLVGLVDIRE